MDKAKSNTKQKVGCLKKLDRLLQNLQSFDIFLQMLSFNEIYNNNLKKIKIQEIKTFRMFNPYQNFYQTYLICPLPCNQTYFNYQQIQYPYKIFPNLILIDNQNQQNQTLSETEKGPEIIISSDTPSKSILQEKQTTSKKTTIKQKKQISASRKKQKKIKKQAKRQEINQKQGRNCHSNILRKFFKLIFVQSQIYPKIEKVIFKYKFDVSAEEFFTWIKTKAIDHRNYIRVRQIEWLFQSTENPVNKIARIIFQDFLKNYYIEHLLSSKKTNNSSVIFHLEGKRKIIEEILSQTLKN